MTDETTRPALPPGSPDDWIRFAIAEHESALVRYAQHFVSDLQRAQDVVQDTFLKLCRLSETERQALQGHVSRWLFKVCRNRAIDVSRKENRMKIASSEHLDDQLADDSQSPSAKLESREQHDSVAAQIRQLSRNQQEVLRLKFNGGLSYKEIAEVTGLTTSNVGVLLHTAINKLRQRVATQS